MKYEKITMGRRQTAAIRASQSWRLWLGCAAMAVALSAAEAAPQTSRESNLFSVADTRGRNHE